MRWILPHRGRVLTSKAKPKDRLDDQCWKQTISERIMVPSAEMEALNFHASSQSEIKGFKI